LIGLVEKFGSMLITVIAIGVHITEEAGRVGIRTIPVVIVTAMTTELGPVLTGVT